MAALFFMTGTGLADLYLNECLSANLSGLIDFEGDHEDWIELINTGSVPLDLFSIGLSDDPDDPMKWTFPSRWIGAGDVLIVFASGKNQNGDELHTNFKISSEGETIFLSDSDGQLLDFLTTGPLPGDISIGRKPDGVGDWFYFAVPTPFLLNRTSEYEGVTSPPQFSIPGGFHSGGLSLEIFDSLYDTQIRYSTDGSDPDFQSALYETPIIISQTTIVRARAFKDGYLPGPIVTHSYFFDESSELPILSLVTDPDNLWDSETGIYVLGDEYNSEWPFFGANFWEDWEKPAHLEYFEAQGNLGFSLDLGIKIHGNWSRALPQKSIRLHPRGGYGQSEIEYRIFSDRPFQSYKRLILRSAGNDWCVAHMRDALGQSLAKSEDIDLQAYRPVLLFLNGEYWGVHNLRERLDKFYLADHHGIDMDELDLLERNHEMIEGDAMHYLGILDYLESYSMSDPDRFAYIQTQMDTDNFATWTILEVFFGNDDWPGNNTRFWRPRNGDGRWRWMLFDLDMSFGFSKPHDYDFISEALWENPDYPWTTFLLRSLIANDEFKRDFINRYADMLNTIFLPERTVSRLNEMKSELTPEMGRHMIRWDKSPIEWLDNLTVLDSFLDTRPEFARQNLQSRFYLPDTLSLSLDIDPPLSGSLQLTGTVVDTAYCGVYFKWNPIPVKALPRPGWIFSGWSDASLPQEAEIILDISEAYSLSAYFEQDTAWSPLVINEINYHSSDDFDPGDWVEIHNPGGTAWNASGLVFMDEGDDEAYTLPEGTLIPPGGFLVLCCELNDFTALFPDVSPVLGDLEFSFSGGGDFLRLYDAEGEIIDWVAYDDDPPWPPGPDGEGPTLELIDPGADNSQAQFWSSSSGHGSPGSVNSSLASFVGDELLPASPQLDAPWPNPFNPKLELRFTLDRPRDLRLTAHDVAGRLVAILAEGYYESGEHALNWDGHDREGQSLSSGVYFLRLDTSMGIQSRKVVLLR
jgi:hypothetical protein